VCRNDGLNGVKRVAEDHGVTICVELLNSKVNHKGYRGDHMSFVMGRDAISTIRANQDSIGHYTGGMPDVMN